VSAVDDAVAGLRRRGIPVDAPVGTVRTTGRTTADDGWLLFGQTVLNAQSIYPALWDVVPVGWRSGSSLVLPNMADRMVEGVGVTAVGATGGANSKTIGANNLPTHTHPVDPPDTNLAMPGTLGGTTGGLWGDYGAGAGSGAIPTLQSASGFSGQAHMKIPLFTSGTNTTTATALDVTPAHLALVYQIRAF
jgi:hypothetical protein